mmetsp:Transcript_24174/g.43688  ORF Transcript_24174/g.43688 Transcript_24174/m.43688 type:complete len:82 (+) Transcript_24174:131-376(+)
MAEQRRQGKAGNSFQERLAWLGRMPMRYRVLFGTQALIFSFALKIRLSDMDRAKGIAAAKEHQQAMLNNADGTETPTPSDN